MINETFPVQVEGSLPDTKLVTYIQDTYQEVGISARPLVLICPGGAYAYTSNREAEAFAMQFLAMGMLSYFTFGAGAQYGFDP